MICGVDEAGRGPVVGPLVVAGVLGGEGEIEALSKLGVKDSKMLTPARREALYEEISKSFNCHVVRVDAGELDRLMAAKTLNEIEAECYAKVIEALGPVTAYVDAADASCRNFERMILKYLVARPSLIVEHKADERYPAVSAASIVAKVERDRAIRALHKIHGDFGSGYSSDVRTQRFLKRYFQENGSFPGCVRRRWKTAIRIAQPKIDEYL
jgi:ribonuclease HII